MSGRGVLAALQSQGVDAHAFDPAERELAELKREGFARVFIALHGRHGEDGTVQGALELLGIPYTGSRRDGQRDRHGQGDDQARLGAPRACRRRPGSGWRPSSQSRADVVAVPDTLGLPLIVKPPREGSSIGITKVAGYSQMQDAVALAARYDADVLCEAIHRRHRAHLPGAGPGRRGARAAGDPHRRARRQLRLRAQVLHRRRPATAARAACSAADEAEVQRLTLAAYRTLGCRGWGRADLMQRASDAPALPAGNEHQPRHDRPLAGADVGACRRHELRAAVPAPAARREPGLAARLSRPLAMATSTATLSLPPRRARPARPVRAARVALPLDVRLMNGVATAVFALAGAGAAGGRRGRG